MTEKYGAIYSYHQHHHHIVVKNKKKREKKSFLFFFCWKNVKFSTESQLKRQSRTKSAAAIML